MGEKVLLGRGKQIKEISSEVWKKHLEQAKEHSQIRPDFMTEAHQQVRYFVVSELMRVGKPLSLEFISERLKMPLEQGMVILDELERRLFYLVRDGQGAVAWAYPVTVEPTPHRLNFSTGEKLYGAGAEDAIAAPFVEGKLRKAYLQVEIETKCSHCSRAMHLTIDSDLRIAVGDEGAAPWVFMPDTDWEHFAGRTIIDAYGRNTVFFWSEEHAREYRMNTDQVDGMYLTLEQCAYMTPITQGRLFGLE